MSFPTQNEGEILANKHLISIRAKQDCYNQTLQKIEGFIHYFVIGATIHHMYLSDLLFPNPFKYSP